MERIMNPTKLIRFIESHGQAAWIDSADRLGVVAVLVARDGTVIHKTEYIEASARAVRDWLGY
jgi:hypothetical protein